MKKDKKNGPVSPMVASRIPQHPLLTKRQWDRLQRGDIKQFTYHSVYGPTVDDVGVVFEEHAAAFVVTAKDAP